MKHPQTRRRRDPRTGKLKGGNLIEKTAASFGRSAKKLTEEFGEGGYMAHNGPWNVPKRGRWKTEGALPEEDGDWGMKYKAMYEGNFLSG